MQDLIVCCAHYKKNKTKLIFFTHCALTVNRTNHRLQKRVSSKVAKCVIVDNGDGGDGARHQIIICVVKYRKIWPGLIFDVDCFIIGAQINTEY